MQETPCMNIACKIAMQLPADMHDFEICSTRSTNTCMYVTIIRASSSNQAEPVLYLQVLGNM